MLMLILAIVVGLIFLVLSADRFVAGSAAIANNFGVPHMIIGVTIVSLGTSSPEIVAAILAALDNRAEIAMGNAIGSNIANIGLVLGSTALIAATPISKKIIFNENLIMLGATVLTGVLLLNLGLTRLEGAVLLAGLVAFLIWIYLQQGKSSEEVPEDLEENIPKDMTNRMAAFQFIGGLIVLIVSARVLLWGATGIADAYGISEAIIGATIIAVGTSLPEMAASIASALKRHHDIAIGNVLGSNIFNLLAVLAVPGLLSPGNFLPEVFYRDYLFMLALTALMFVVLIVQGIRQKPLNRFVGTVFVLSYLLYGYIAYQSVAG